ncbi:MAG: hypothetical protein K0R62_6062 [Nonomuraea muscovyensis]|nr:hypothetical protein [Nonomuraea muscovyensis]
MPPQRHPLPDLEVHYHRIVEGLAESLPDGSITWCHAVSADDVAAALGGEPSSAARRSLWEGSGEAGRHVQRSGHGKTLIIGELGSWFVVVEPDDWNGSEALPRLSAGGEALSLWLGDTMRHYDLHYARDGQELCRFRWGAEPDGDSSPLAGLLSGLSLTSGLPSWEALESGLLSFDEWKVHALILVERITGVRLTRQWLSREHTRFVQGPHSRDARPGGDLWL